MRVPLCPLIFLHRSHTPRPYTGVDHLLYNGRGVGGQREEAVELHVACFMGLISFLAGRLEVVRVAPWHTKALLNAAARANIQTATVTSTPLTDAGLNGTGEVIQASGFYRCNRRGKRLYTLLFVSWLNALCWIRRGNQVCCHISGYDAAYARTKPSQRQFCQPTPKEWRA